MAEKSDEILEIEEIWRNWERNQKQFAFSLEKSIKAFNLAADVLKPEQILEVREVLRLISDAFSRDKENERAEILERLNKKISELAASEDVIQVTSETTISLATKLNEIFLCLMEILPQQPRLVRGPPPPRLPHYCR